MTAREAGQLRLPLEPTCGAVQGPSPVAWRAVVECGPSSTAAGFFCWSRQAADAGGDSGIALKPGLHPLPQTAAFLGSGEFGHACNAPMMRLIETAIVLLLVSSVTREASANLCC